MTGAAPGTTVHLGPAAVLAFGGPMALALAYAGVDGVRRYGARCTGLLLAAAVLTGGLLEELSIRTGRPFGHYHHNTGPKVLDVPVSVGVAYFAIGYLAWRVAETLLTEAGPVLLPALAAVLAAAYDLTVDPVAATVDHLWTWQDGGAYLGVPPSNTLGWLLTCYLFLQLFALAVRRRPPPPADGRLPALLFLAVGAAPVLAWLNALRTADRPATDGAGHRWSTLAVYRTTALTSLATVCLVSLAALALHQLRDRARPAG